MQKQHKLGDGTFGIVYSARSPENKRSYAIKRNIVEEESDFMGSSRELDILTKLRGYPYIVKLQGVSFGIPFNKDVFSPLDPRTRVNQRDDSVHFIFDKADYDLHHFIYEID